MSGVRRVFAGVSGSPGSVRALRYAEGLARENHAALIPVLVWTPPGGEMVERTHPSRYLRQVWADAAWQRLWTAVDLALGGVPDDLEFDPRAVRGEPAEVLVDITGAEGDVLVVGTGRRGPLRRLLACHISRYCLAHARCPVVAVPPPSLAHLGRGLRGWALRHRGLNLARAGLQPGR